MEDEQQQLEALAKWWRENWYTLVFGLALGISAIGGWNYWQLEQLRKAQIASDRYENLLNTARQEGYDRVRPLVQSLLTEFPDSGYAPLAALVAASSALAQPNPEAAREHLEWVVAHANGLELEPIARVHLAHLLLDQDDPDGALAMLKQIPAGPYDISVNEVRGDIYVASEKPEQAAAAYRDVLGAAGANDTTRRRVQMKLDDLGLGTEPVSAPATG